jgi:hypothetical protein
LVTGDRPIPLYIWRDRSVGAGGLNRHRGAGRGRHGYRGCKSLLWEEAQKHKEVGGGRLFLHILLLYASTRSGGQPRCQAVRCWLG